MNKNEGTGLERSAVRRNKDMSDGHKGTSWVWPKAGSPIPEAKLSYLRETLRLSLTLSSKDSNGAPSLRSALKKAGAMDPLATLACYASPFVGIPLRAFVHRGCWPHLSDTIRKSYNNVAPHVFFELAVRRLLPDEESVDWTASAPPLASPAINVVLYPPSGATGWRFESGQITVLKSKQRGCSIQLTKDLVQGCPLHGEIRCERAYVELQGGIKLALIDPNPLASLEDHPERDGNNLDLGGRPVEDWQTAFSTALGWIADYAPDLFKEITGLLAHVVPVGFLTDRHVSSTYREALGTVYLSLHPDPLIIAEALIHEFQHNKLYLARRKDAILLNAKHSLYRSPVRPDPRPLWGILLAAHAFLPVAAFHRLLRERGHPDAFTPAFEKRLYEIDNKNLEAMKTLRAHARWTEFGTALFEELKVYNVRHVAEWKKRGVSVRPSDAHDN